MAAENNEVLEVCGVSDSLAPPNNEEGGGTEMTMLTGGGDVAGDVEGSNVGVPGENQLEVHKASIEEPSVLFVVKDITKTDWSSSWYNCSLPQSTAVTDLYAAVAKESGMTSSLL